MELRQLRYFVTLAEELHFGRAAAREHIVQSALSQQLQRLERELGVLLIERTTHHVQLSASGTALLIEARQILAHVDRAAVAAQRAARSTPSLRVGIVDAGYDSMPLILHEVQQRYPDLEIHQVEAGCLSSSSDWWTGGWMWGSGGRRWRRRQWPPSCSVSTRWGCLSPTGTALRGSPPSRWPRWPRSRFCSPKRSGPRSSTSSWSSCAIGRVHPDSLQRDCREYPGGH